MGSLFFEAAVLSWDIWRDATPEEEEELLKKAGDLIEQYKMEPLALLLLETMKPLVYVGGEFGRFFIAPLLPFLDHKPDAIIQTFQQRKNIDKLLLKIEGNMKEKNRKKREERKELKMEKKRKGAEKRKWWFF